MARNLIDHHQAAKILGCGPQKIQALVRQGFLRPIQQAGAHNKKFTFDRDEVEAYLEIRGDAIDLPKVARWAMQARAQTAALQRHVDELTRALGLEVEMLPTEPADVLALYRQALEAAEQPGIPPPAEVVRWGQVLHSLDDQYLDIVATVAGTSEPWLAYLRVADNILAAATSGLLAQSAALTYACSALTLARRHTLAVAYFYVQVRHGTRLADENFLTSYVDDEVLALMRDY